MLPTNNASIYRVATAYEAAKEAQTVAPDAASATRDLGRARFYDALAGRYGLPGDALSGLGGSAFPDDPDTEQRYDLQSMSVDEILALADSLRGSGRLESGDADLMGYHLDALPFAQDSVFSRSPVADFARSLTGTRSSAADRTLDLIGQQEEQIRYLTENDADPRAIRGAKAVLGQLHQLRAEQALYAQMDSSRDSRDKKESGGFGPFGALTDLINLPASTLALFSSQA